MSSVRYIGSKARLVEAIMSHVGEPGDGAFVDAFCGTGAVAEAAAKIGWPVRVNDHLNCAVAMATGRMTSHELAPFVSLGGYHRAVATLNKAPAKNGFIWREYSPASASHAGLERRYFTEDNAKKIDGIRARIRAWKMDGRINDAEERLLIADLIGAANKVANTAGTYGCFLSTWQRMSLDDLALTPRVLPVRMPAVDASVGDATEVECEANDVVYLDPPYTKRQYAAYYHILETITLGDEPKVEGVSGIRPWRHIASDYCYRSRATSALASLVSSIPARRVLLSYSTEGHAPLDDLADALAPAGRVTINPLMNVGRYRPNQAASDGASFVGEVLISIERSEVDMEVAA